MTPFPALRSARGCALHCFVDLWKAMGEISVGPNTGATFVNEVVRERAGPSCPRRDGIEASGQGGMVSTTARISPRAAGTSLFGGEPGEADRGGDSGRPLPPTQRPRSPHSRALWLPAAWFRPSQNGQPGRVPFRESTVPEVAFMAQLKKVGGSSRSEPP